MKLKPQSVHPKGEEQKISNDSDNHQMAGNTYAGKVFVEWDSNAAVTPLAQLPFFTGFLELGGRFTPWVDNCPLTYLSPNAPRKRNVLGSLFLSILSGHHRYTHMANLLSDRASPKWLDQCRFCLSWIKNPLMNHKEFNGYRHTDMIAMNLFGILHGLWMSMLPLSPCMGNRKAQK